MSNGINILHFTDLHISIENTMEEIDELWKKIFMQLEEYQEKIDIVLISGDLTSHGLEKEYTIVQRKLDKILSICNVGKNRVVICPGNHDADSINEGSSFYHYEKFISDFYKHAEYEFIYSVNNKKVNIYSINTNSRISLADPDNAYISQNDYENIQHKICEDDCNILLMHHQPYTIKNKELLDSICKKTDYIFCGHNHPNNVLIKEYGKTQVIVSVAVNPYPMNVSQGVSIINLQDGKILVNTLFV